MAQTIENLLDTLQTKDKNAEVEFVIVQTDGKLIAADLTSDRARKLVRFLEMFGAKTQGES